MKKQIFGRKFGRDKNERKALFSGLISSMILKGRISTTEEKAKSVRGDLEKLVTKAKKGESSRLELKKKLKPFEMDKMINDIAPVFSKRNGGYTRIIKTGRRFGDNASTAILEWVDYDQIASKEKQKKEAKKKAKKPVIKAQPKKRLSLGRVSRGKSSAAKAKEDK